MAEGRLPSFMVIGAVKAATTWIGHQLRHHPMLWLPDAEPHFFSSEYARGVDWYRSLFAGAPADRIVGEKSADYLAHPEAAGRISALLPGIPLIVQLRDPVERAYSDYCMLYRRGQVGGDPRHYLDGRVAAGGRFLEGGRYAHHIRRLYEHIPGQQLQIILYDDIRREPEAVIARVCEHIGVPVHIAPEAVDDRRNDSRAPTLPLPLRRILRPARPLLDPMRSNPWLARVWTSLARPVRYPPLTEELRAMLRDYYRDDIRDLATLLKRDLSGWLCNDRAVA
ncbi:sulfotransferase family protein [Sphingomonas sp. PR090111-T3T-6A]|uniref:sulfotransferase family protein n=1 Tax=Sphingomonas sp. PR090111-T3T-6A TaxID=685778 RepID=UPI00037CF71F|nr:sulfotransferase [Sphingomonas sp. PR090111-T3T-6A]